jgi:hypothetical protein
MQNIKRGKSGGIEVGGWRDGCMDGLERRYKRMGTGRGRMEEERMEMPGTSEGIGCIEEAGCRDEWREYTDWRAGEPIVWWRDIRGWVERWGE